MSETLAAKTLRGIGWTYAATAVNAGLQIALTAVLARLVAPSAFGLMAMAALALRFGQYFAQMGVGQALVQTSELDDDDVAFAFLVSLATGAGMTGAFFVASPGIAFLFHDPGLTALMRTMSASFGITGASLVSLALLRRAMAFRGIAIVDVISYSLGYGAIGVGAAVMGAGVWSLAAAALSQCLFQSVGYYGLTRHKIRIAWRSLRSNRLLAFGSRVSVLGFLEFIASNLDTMSVGRLLGEAALGFYSRALSLANLPLQYLSISLSRVLLPSLAKIQKDEVRIREAYLTSFRMFAAIGLPIAAGLVVAARPAILSLLGPKWTTSIQPLRIVALGAPLTVLTHFGEVVCEARASLNIKLVLRVGQIAAFAVLLAALASRGLMGFAVAFVASEALLHVAYLFVMAGEIAVDARMYAEAYGPGLAFALVVGVVVAGTSSVGERLGFAAGVTLLACVLFGGSVLVALVLRGAHGSIWRVLREWIDRGRLLDPASPGGRAVTWVDRHLAWGGRDAA